MPTPASDERDSNSPRRSSDRLGARARYIMKCSPALDLACGDPGGTRRWVGCCVVVGAPWSPFGGRGRDPVGPDNRVSTAVRTGSRRPGRPSSPHRRPSLDGSHRRGDGGGSVAARCSSVSRDDVDVADYLAGTAYTRIDTIDLPWTHDDDRGRRRQQGSRRSHRTRTSGSSATPAEDKATIRFPMPDAAVDLVVIDADGKPAFQADLTIALVQGRGVRHGAGARRRRARRRLRPALLLLRRAPRRGATPGRAERTTYARAESAGERRTRRRWS